MADMQARILLNLGLMNEHKSNSTPSKVSDAINNYEKAIKICKSNDIFDLHHSSLMALGYFYALKLNDSISAMQTYNNALEVAKRIESRNEKMCETLLAKGNLLIKNGDFQSAKQALKKAFKLKTTIASDMEAIQKKFRIVSALCKYEDELITTDSLDYVKRKELFEKLGDATCKVKNYEKAIDFYKKTLEAAELNGDMGKRLIPIYVSLYQTFIDMKDYESALKFLHMEYDLIKDIPKEACTTLLSIANLLHLAKRDFWEIDDAYRRALVEARLCDDFSLERVVMKKLTSVCREFNMTSLAEMLVLEAAEKHIDLTSNDDNEEEEIEFSEEIDLNDVIVVDSELSTDAESSDGNDSIHIQNVPSSGRRKKSLAIKKNAKGETRLHEACINGNYQLVKMLIEQGHAINVRDNAGWLPLHEASNHGHRDVVELLLDNGAQSMINDKGGTNCDGISPLYDAASNGHLRVIQLLLDRGAKATIKTDANETPLDGLIRWYKSSDFDPSEKDFYEELKARLEEQCEKVGIDTKSKTHLSSLASSGYGSIPRSSEQQQQQQQQQRHNLRFTANFSDESDNDSSSSDNNQGNKESRRKNAGEDYKNVIERLRRNPNREAREHDNLIENKKRSAYLSAKEIDPDDWLDNDLGHAKKKQKFFNEKNLSNIDDLPPQPQTSSLDKFNLLSEKTMNDLLDLDQREDRVIVGGKVSDYDTNTNTLHDAFDMMMFNAEESYSTKKKSRRNSQTKVSQNKNSSANQSSLLDAGFSRFIDFTDEIASPSSTKKSFPSPINSHNSSFNESLNRNSAASSGEKQMTIIKVQIDGEKIIVPINREVANELKISWLIEESAKRYYR